MDVGGSDWIASEPTGGGQADAANSSPHAVYASSSSLIAVYYVSSATDGLRRSTVLRRQAGSLVLLGYSNSLN